MVPKFDGTCRNFTGFNFYNFYSFVKNDKNDIKNLQCLFGIFKNQDFGKIENFKFFLKKAQGLAEGTTFVKYDKKSIVGLG